VGLFLILFNLVIGWNANNYPKDPSDLENALFYGFSRPSFVTGVLLILVSIFTGHYPVIQATLSTSLMRIFAKAMPIACTLVILSVQLIYCSDALPKGFMITFPIALGVGVGLIFVTLITSVIMMVFFEFPITRLLQMTFRKLLSHDELLRGWHLRKQAKLLEEIEMELDLSEAEQR
jgi:hypothetical protein